MRTGYHQFCAVARALELVEQRWTLLVVRELLLRGPLPKAAIARGLPDVPSNQLTERIAHLEAAGLVGARDVGTCGVRRREYALTPAGRELEPVVDALAEFGLAWMDWPRAPGEVVLPHVLMRQLELRYDRERATCERFSGRFLLVLDDVEVMWSLDRFGMAPARWSADASERRLRVRPGACARPDAALRMTVATCTALVAREPGAVIPLQIEGDRARALKFLSLLAPRRRTDTGQHGHSGRTAPRPLAIHDMPRQAVAG